jgi:hypothetical protein
MIFTNSFRCLENHSLPLSVTFSSSNLHSLPSSAKSLLFKGEIVAKLTQTTGIRWLKMTVPLPNIGSLEQRVNTQRCYIRSRGRRFHNARRSSRSSHTRTISVHRSAVPPSHLIPPDPAAYIGGCSSDGCYMTGYTEVVNLLDYSTAVIPVTTADKSIDVIDPNYVPLNDLDGRNWAWCKQSARWMIQGNKRANQTCYQMTQKLMMTHPWGCRLWPGSMKKRKFGL